MKIYLFRHGEKAQAFHPNPGLSERGAQQALCLVEKVQEAELPKPTQLWISPKKRTHESFAPLAQQLGLELKVVEDLDEKRNGENRHEFRDRIDRLFQKVAREEGVIFLCSHSDWIEEALAILPSDTDLNQYFQWSPLQYIGLNYKNEIFEFIEHKRIPL